MWTQLFEPHELLTAALYHIINKLLTVRHKKTEKYSVQAFMQKYSGLKELLLDQSRKWWANI